MTLKVIDAKEEKKRQWIFCMSEKEMREVLLDVIAWNIILKTGKDSGECIELTLKADKGIAELSAQEINDLRNPFVKAIAATKVRLGI